MKRCREHCTRIRLKLETHYDTGCCLLFYLGIYWPTDSGSATTDAKDTGGSGNEFLSQLQASDKGFLKDVITLKILPNSLI